jgi:hypothetical protein
MAADDLSHLATLDAPVLDRDVVAIRRRGKRGAAHSPRFRTGIVARSCRVPRDPNSVLAATSSRDLTTLPLGVLARVGLEI